MTRVILHADMDAFYAAVEQRDDPALRGKPVIVGGTSSRGVVSAASYEARRHGIHSAMPTIEARRRCPQGIFLRGSPAKYARESRRIFGIFERFSPCVEGLSLDEAFLDLTGSERLLGTPRQVAGKLRAAVRLETGLTVSCGIGPIKMVAKIASDLAKPDGVIDVAPDQVAGFLAPLPIGRIFGVGPEAERRLLALGLTTIGELAQAPDAWLEARLGRRGCELARLARGNDPRGVESGRAAKSYGEENTFPRDVSDAALLRKTLRVHADAVARRLRRDSVRARTVQLKLKLARRLGGGRYPLLTRSRTLRESTDDGAQLARAACDLLERAALVEPVRLLGVTALQITPAGAEQLSLLESPVEQQRRRALNRVVDAIHSRFGPRALARGSVEIERAGLTSRRKPGEVD